MTLNDIGDDAFYDATEAARKQSERIATHVADTEPFLCPACSQQLWDRERGLCTCSDPVCLSCHAAEHRPGAPYRCATCGDLAMSTGTCVKAERGRCA